MVTALYLKYRTEVPDEVYLFDRDHSGCDRHDCRDASAYICAFGPQTQDHCSQLRIDFAGKPVPRDCQCYSTSCNIRESGRRLMYRNEE